MIFVDYLNNPPPDAWIVRADIATAQIIAAATSEDRAIIIRRNSGLWGELKSHLSLLKNRKCWYTESINDGAHCHIDHFRPKTNALDENGVNQGGYWWLTFDWQNYRYSGPVSNVRKKDYFPVLSNKVNAYGGNTNLEQILLLDPLVIADTWKLSFDGVEGKILPKATDKNSLDFKRAEYSIERYNLNDEGLKEGRRQKYGRAKNLINESAKLLKLQTVTYDLARENDIIKIWIELKELANPNSEYSATVKYCLKSSGHDWALDIAIAA